ncbi:hypothetical protein [Gimesia algae]|uniref:Type I restriction enzyme R protein N-terminal domain-containing protein n=1 Tax=Gimesia algae TaxID=2527971 RepID=A0A517VFH4_9PLAN|nr:hypothetical protein [Gimesia algae]QDT91736.1 hypothetical protein Pan161_33990 [Gimesia algae]
MIPFDSKWSDVEALIRVAISELKGDEILFRIHANERSITHRLAVCLEKHFVGWNVDCEYSRIGEDSSNYKRLLLPSAENVTHFDMNGSRVYPDIVIHHRGQNATSDNLLVIEAKTVWSQVPDEQDIRKLKAFTGEYPVNQFIKYRFGLFLKFDESGEAEEFQLFDSNLKDFRE